jgi:ectoine hydroxylase-related dioxygenase (phytanoyl-CoA dioxygenase family)
VELLLKAGDALLFTDGVAHGSSARKNPGYRRTLLYRYCPAWISTRWNYLPSPELMARLTEERRKIVQPVKPRVTPGWGRAAQGR